MTPYNPTRRNRNIGTAAQGHGKSNRLVIPRPRHDRVYWESIASCEVEKHIIHGSSVTFVRETLTPGWFHACSVSDVLLILQSVPAADLVSMNCILFRQPTRKQTILNPSWGRLTYHATVGIPGRADIYVGPLITLEACQNPTILKWSKSLDIGAQRELKGLRGDGHLVAETSRHFIISANEQSIRTTQMYRTLPHEIGHWVDYLEKVVRPSELESDRWSEFDDSYFSRPPSEREAFAHRYADGFRRELGSHG